MICAFVFAYAKRFPCVVAHVCAYVINHHPTNQQLTIVNFSRYRIWHYTGVILEQVTLATGQELWEVFWQPAPSGVYKEKNINYRPVQSDVQTPMPESE